MGEWREQREWERSEAGVGGGIGRGRLGCLRWGGEGRVARPAGGREGKGREAVVGRERGECCGSWVCWASQGRVGDGQGCERSEARQGRAGQGRAELVE
jgi:hypothetical protein